MPKCRIEGCNRQKDLSPDGLCQVCVLAAASRSSSHTQPSLHEDFSKFESLAEKLNNGEKDNLR